MIPAAEPGSRGAGSRPPVVSPVDVRVVLADGREIPVECRYTGWNGSSHVWEAVYTLPEIPVAARVGMLPARTAVVVPVNHPRPTSEQM